MNISFNELLIKYVINSILVRRMIVIRIRLESSDVFVCGRKTFTVYKGVLLFPVEHAYLIKFTSFIVTANSCLKWFSQNGTVPLDRLIIQSSHYVDGKFHPVLSTEIFFPFCRLLLPSLYNIL